MRVSRRESDRCLISTISRSTPPAASGADRCARRAPTTRARQLGARKLYVVRIEPRAEGAATPLLSRQLFARRKLSAKQLTLFTRQLATLVTVSPLEEALRTIARQAEQRACPAGAAVGPRRRGRGAAPCPTRWRAKPASFPPLYRAMVAAGEGSGTLPRNPRAARRSARTAGAGARQGDERPGLSDRARDRRDLRRLRPDGLRRAQGGRAVRAWSASNCPC